jgi:hypothetical protein
MIASDVGEFAFFLFSGISLPTAFEEANDSLHRLPMGILERYHKTAAIGFITRIESIIS